jgi:hypothetical protein
MSSARKQGKSFVMKRLNVLKNICATQSYLLPLLRQCLSSRFFRLQQERLRIRLL